MASADPAGHAARASTPGPGPGGVPGRLAGPAGASSGRSGRRGPRAGEQTPAAVEKRGPYMVMRVPSIQAKLRECGRTGVSAWAGCRVPRAGSQGHLLPAPDNKFGEIGFLAFGRHGRVGKTPLTRAL